jgi:hypothetical protein
MTPRFWRIALRVDGVLGLFFAITLITQWQSLRLGHWTILGAIFSIAAPLILAPALAWFMFVPSWFEYSEGEISLRMLFREGTYAWDMLEAYGPGRGVFMIQFKGDSSAYQIISGAYSRTEWKAFRSFLETRFPDRKSSFNIGGRLIR